MRPLRRCCDPRMTTYVCVNDRLFLIPYNNPFPEMSERSASLEIGIAFRAQSYFYAVKQ